MVLPWGVHLWICQFWIFSINFFIEFEVGHLKELFFLSRIPFCIFYGIFIENSCFQPHVSHKQGVVFWSNKMVFYSEKKALSDGLLQIPWKKILRKSKIDRFKINPSRENHAHLISCKPPHKNHSREYFGTTLSIIQIATSVVEKSQILSVAFHLSSTVQAHYVVWSSLKPPQPLFY